MTPDFLVDGGDKNKHLINIIKEVEV